MVFVKEKNEMIAAGLRREGTLVSRRKLLCDERLTSQLDLKAQSRRRDKVPIWLQTLSKIIYSTITH